MLSRNTPGVQLPYSRKLTHNDFNAKEINAKKINANQDQQEAPRAWKIFVLRILVRKRFGNKIRPVWNIFLTKLSAPSIVGT